MSKITKDHVAKAKAKHIDIYVIEVNAGQSKDLSLLEENAKVTLETEVGEFSPEKGCVYAIVQKPNKKVLGLAMTHKDPIQMGNFILRNTIVSIDGEDYADDEIMQDDAVNVAASLEVITLIEIGQARIKKY